MVIKKEKFLKKAFYEQFGINLQSCYFWSNLTTFLYFTVSKYLVPQKRKGIYRVYKLSYQTLSLTYMYFDFFCDSFVKNHEKMLCPIRDFESP